MLFCVNDLLVAVIVGRKCVLCILVFRSNLGVLSFWVSGLNCPLKLEKLGAEQDREVGKKKSEKRVVVGKSDMGLKKGANFALCPNEIRSAEGPGKSKTGQVLTFNVGPSQRSLAVFC
jgi:hypothetical protein